MRYKIIGESGGTKTDWLVYRSNELVDQFTTGSYHPNLLSEEWIENEEQFWNSIQPKENYSIEFYGAGCLLDLPKTKMKELFQRFGFKEIEVQSDLIAAAKATGNFPNGIVAIMGTGSVLAKIEKGQVSEVIGGKGFKEGDEGSGYYFGKLLLQNYLAGELSLSLSTKLSKLIESEKVNLSNLFDLEGKAFVSNLSLWSSEWDDHQIRELHQTNIQWFANLYLSPLNLSKVDVVGSYAFHHQKLLQSVFTNLNINLGKVIERPILYLK